MARLCNQVLFVALIRTCCSIPFLLLISTCQVLAFGTASWACKFSSSVNETPWPKMLPECQHLVRSRAAQG